MIPPLLKHVATLPCDIIDSFCTCAIIYKAVVPRFWSMAGSLMITCNYTAECASERIVKMWKSILIWWSNEYMVADCLFFMRHLVRLHTFLIAVTD